MYRAPRPFMPQEYVTTLRYTVMYILSLNGVFFNSFYYKTTPYDVDPFIGNTAMPGYTELSKIYQRVRPLRITYRYDCCNNENQPVSLSSGFTSEVLTTPDIDTSGNPLWKTKTVSAKGGMDKTVLKGSATIVQIAGTKQPLYDDLYTSLTSSNTMASQGIVYSYIVADAVAPGTAAGVTIKVNISLTCQFYRMYVLNT